MKINQSGPLSCSDIFYPCALYRSWSLLSESCTLPHISHCTVPWQSQENKWAELNCVCLNPGGSHFVAGDNMGELQLWNLAAIKVGGWARTAAGILKGGWARTAAGILKGGVGGDCRGLEVGGWGL